MIKHAWLASLLCVAGCFGDSVTPPDEPREEAGDEGTEVRIDPARLKNPTSELGTERTRPIAKTIEWAPIGTEQGQTFAGGAIAVEQVVRDDANGLYGVQVRLKNTGKDRQKIQWLIRFYTRDGGQVIAYAGGLGDGARWQGAVIEPYKSVTVGDFARVRGAEGFKLFLRGAGSKDEGSADLPKKVEED
jgi:hypothetical protein